MASDLSLATAIEGSQETTQSRQSLASDFDDFLSLLTVQLQNQDPLNPTSSKELTDQLVQFTQVEQQINSNEKLDTIATALIASLSSTSLGFVGMNATYSGSEFYFDGENVSDFSYALGTTAAQNTIRIVDSSGNTVFNTEGSLTTGAHDFTWDGRNNNGELVEEGTYRFYIDALDSEGRAVDNETIVTGRVRGIENGSTGEVFLLIGERAVSSAQILRIEDPAATNVAINIDDTEDDDGSDDIDDDSTETSDPTDDESDMSEDNDSNPNNDEAT